MNKRFEEVNNLYFSLQKKYVQLDRAELFLSIVVISAVIFLVIGFFVSPLLMLLSAFILTITLACLEVISRKSQAVRKQLPEIREEYEKFFH